MTFTLEQVRQAYWKVFHGAGELWFDYLGSPEENAESTAEHWAEFEAALNETVVTPPRLITNTDLDISPRA